MVKPCPKELKCDVEVGIYSVFQFSLVEHNVHLHFSMVELCFLGGFE
jgi:hypothetical protein